MLILKPNCEYCDRDLAPESPQAMICSYECTFCQQCVESVLHNVCPNCGGGFVPRPVRPGHEYRAGVSITHQPASSERTHVKYDASEIADFIAPIKAVPPAAR